jgi:hypothetical protein
VSRVVLIMGASGAGKSTAIRTLDPKETFIINSLGKDLPFKGSSKLYTYWTKDNPTGHMVKTSHSSSTITWLKHISEKMPQIRNVVIDDNTHQSSMEFIRRINQTGWDKFNDIAANMVSIVEVAGSLRSDLYVFILHHTTEEGDGVVEEKSHKAMTLGKLVDNKMSSYESFFTVVLLAKKIPVESGIDYQFLTQDAHSTTKAPMGMFPSASVPNDLQLVRDSISSYYDE